MKIIIAVHWTEKIVLGCMNSVFARIAAPAAPHPALVSTKIRRLLAQHANTQRRGGGLIVADRLERGAMAAAQQHEQDAPRPMTAAPRAHQ